MYIYLFMYLCICTQKDRQCSLAVIINPPVLQIASLFQESGENKRHFCFSISSGVTIFFHLCGRDI